MKRQGEKHSLVFRGLHITVLGTRGICVQLARDEWWPPGSKALALLEMFLDFRARPPHRLELFAGEQRELIGPVR